MAYFAPGAQLTMTIFCWSSSLGEVGISAVMILVSDRRLGIHMHDEPEGHYVKT